MKNFTFKTDKPVGSYSAFYDPRHYIKYDKREVGSIDPNPPHKIKLQVMKKDINEDGNPNCEWKWITFTMHHDSVADAKVWVNNNKELIFDKYKLIKKATE